MGWQTVGPRHAGCCEQSARTARNVERVERWTQKLGWFRIFLAYVPIPLPIALVVFIMSGATGMKLRTFMVLNCAKTVWNLGYFALGYAIGEPVVYVLEQYQKSSWLGGNRACCGDYGLSVL